MKSTTTRKLQLRSETLRALQASELQRAVGGLNILSIVGEHCVITKQTCLETCQLKPFPTDYC